MPTNFDWIRLCGFREDLNMVFYQNVNVRQILIIGINWLKEQISQKYPDYMLNYLIAI